MAEKAYVRVVDDDPAMRDLLASLLQGAGLSVGLFGSADELVAQDDWARPGCLLLDERLPGRGGVELLGELVAQGCDLPAIIITAYGDVPTAVKAFRAGAFDFVEKPFDHEDLVKRVRSAADVDVSRRAERKKREGIKQRVSSLTPREREVMQLVVEGLPNKKIASQLGISPKTVEAHRAHVMTKMKARSLPDLVRMTESVRKSYRVVGAKDSTTGSA